MEARSTTLLVIGGGPGGYVAAIRAGQLGIATTLVEGDKLGGTCLNIGCIPSKALIHAAGQFEKACGYAQDSPLGIHVASPRIELAQTVRWKDGIVTRLTGGVARLLKKSGVQVVSGWARIIDGKTVEVTSGAGQETLRLVCEHLLLAPGSQAVALPAMPFGGRVISSTEALAPQALPKRLVVVGAGYIGLELGTAYRKLGAEVAVVEALDRVLPAYDDELAKPVTVACDDWRIGLLHRASDASGDAASAAQGEESALPADQVPSRRAGRVPRLGPDLDAGHERSRRTHR
jgi:dihydrolipoamide dehydrogenase